MIKQKEITIPYLRFREIMLSKERAGEWKEALEIRRGLAALERLYIMTEHPGPLFFKKLIQSEKNKKYWPEYYQKNKAKLAAKNAEYWREKTKDIPKKRASRGAVGIKNMTPEERLNYQRNWRLKNKKSQNALRESGLTNK
jgi:hypothetical protein